MQETILEIKRNSGNFSTNSASSNNVFSPQGNTFSGFNNVPASTLGFNPPQPSLLSNTSSHSQLFRDPAPTFSFSLDTNPNCNTGINITQPLVQTQHEFNSSPVSQNNQKTFNGISQTSQVNCESNYSKLSELSESDLNSFRSDSFNLGQIPLKPPPKELIELTKY